MMAGLYLVILFDQSSPTGEVADHEKIAS